MGLGFSTKFYPSKRFIVHSSYRSILAVCIVMYIVKLFLLPVNAHVGLFFETAATASTEQMNVSDDVDDLDKSARCQSKRH